MRKQHHITHSFWGIIAFSLLSLFTACKEDYPDVLPYNGDIANVNFDCMAEALIQNSGASASVDLAPNSPHYIYINDSVPTEHYQRYPQFAGDANRDIFRYPASPSTTPVPDDIGQGDGTYERLFWMPLIADGYTFNFANGFKTYLVDTAVTLTKGTYTSYYLVESPISDFAYTAVAVPIERKSSEGHTRIQVVNLSPDLGEVDVIRTDHHGNEITSGLPGRLGFGAIVAPSEISIEGTDETDGYIILKFRKVATGETVQSVAVPALSNSAFTVLLHGFEVETRRWYRRTREDDYISVTLAANLRVKLRRIQ